ncbi:nucleotidyl transferase AbiEii/AbiGii toxin family protein [Candidatus Micrarchaeota archaeon]|nr:nucleotidyl transferase AbiEii/AbiGii toxin family protein [Candidatus Micrarchaeota archaeon]
MKTGEELKKNLELRDRAETVHAPYGFIADQLIREGVFREKDRNFLLKDLKLTLLLSRIYSSPWAFRNLVFKGGTCLVKYYLDYYRFSEDIDLSFIPRKNDAKNRKKVDDLILQSVSQLGWTAEVRSHTEHNYRSYVIATNDGVALKLSVSFNELFLFTPFKTRLVEVRGTDKLQPHPNLEKFRELIGSHEVQVYDEKEILVEKYRCVLTRKLREHNVGRDLLDLFKLEQKGVRIGKNELAVLVVKKILQSRKNGFGMGTLRGVLSNLSGHLSGLLQKALEEQKLLTEPLDSRALEGYARNELLPVLQKIREAEELKFLQ